MKKFLVMFAIAGALASCNNSSDTTANPDSSGKDSNAMQSTPPDSNSFKTNPDSNNKMGGDTNNHKADSSNKAK
jgi:hypothetical protein